MCMICSGHLWHFIAGTPLLIHGLDAQSMAEIRYVHISGICLFFWSVLIVKGQIVDSPGLKFGPGFGVRRLMFVCQRGILNWLWKNMRRKPQPNGQAYHGFRAHMDLKYWLKGLDWLDWTEVPWRIFPLVWFSFLIPTPTPMGLLLRMQTYENSWNFSWNQMKAVWVLWVWGFWMWMNKWSFVSLSGTASTNFHDNFDAFDLTFVPGLDFLAGHGLTSSARLTLKKRKPRPFWLSREHFWLRLL